MKAIEAYCERISWPYRSLQYTTTSASRFEQSRSDSRMRRSSVELAEEALQGVDPQVVGLEKSAQCLACHGDKTATDLGDPHH